MKVPSPIHSASARQNSSGVLENSATNTSDITAPIDVPSIRYSDFASTIPENGCETMYTVVTDQLGCDRSRRNAMYSASIAAMNVFSENIPSRQVDCRRVCNIERPQPVGTES